MPSQLGDLVRWYKAENQRKLCPQIWPKRVSAVCSTCSMQTDSVPWQEATEMQTAALVMPCGLGFCCCLAVMKTIHLTWSEFTTEKCGEQSKTYIENSIF